MVWAPLEGVWKPVTLVRWWAPVSVDRDGLDHARAGFALPRLEASSVEQDNPRPL